MKRSTILTKKILNYGVSLGLLILLIPLLYIEGIIFMNKLIDLNYLDAFKTFFFPQYLRINGMILLLMVGLIVFKACSSVITINGAGIFVPILFMSITTESFF
ncbi:MAG: hypothetical protein ACMUEM_04110 [Flavobacteriales bacterium AspAUS03]